MGFMEYQLKGDKEMNKQIAVKGKVSILAKLGGKYNVDPQKLLTTLKATAFKVKNGVSDEQMVSLLVVADQYDLNPFTREIFAFPDKQGGIVPVVGVDGWLKIINSHPQTDGFEFNECDEIERLDDLAKDCPAWIEVTIYRKDRKHPIKAKEYLDEVYRPAFQSQGRKISGPWQTHTKRMLRHKALIQGARLAFGFSGIYDEDEAKRVIEMQVPDTAAIEMPKKKEAESPKEEATPAVTEPKKKLGRPAKTDPIPTIEEPFFSKEDLDEATEKGSREPGSDDE